MAVAFFGDLIFMVYTRALDRKILFLIPAPDTARAVGSAELFFVPYKSTDHRITLLFISIESPSVLFCISFCPFEHLFLFGTFFWHAFRPHPTTLLIHYTFLYQEC